MKFLLFFLVVSSVIFAMNSAKELQVRQKIKQFLIQNNKCKDEGTATVLAGELQLHITAHVDILKTRYTVDLESMKVTESKLSS